MKAIVGLIASLGIALFWGKSVVVENLTGSGGNLAVERAAEFAGVIRSETEQWAKLISDAGIKVTE
jgi:tripartite-type tricarboxylate transporter receptor subunit TctC